MQIEPSEYLKRLANGDKATINRLYKNTFPKVLNFIKKNNGTLPDAEDVFQNALLQIIARYKLRSFSLKDKLEPYFFTACRNLWLRELNKLNREVTNKDESELISEGYDMSIAVLEQEKWDLFQEKLTDLSKNCQEVLRMFFKTVSYAEMTKRLKYSSENVLRQRIFKCKKKLSELVKSDQRYRRLK